MEKKNGPWTITGSRQVFKNDFLTLKEDSVIRPHDGGEGKYTTVTLKTGVATLPIDTQGNVYLVRQFRYALETYSLEAIAGGLDGDEDILEAAKRELREELGITANEWIPLGCYAMDTAIVRSPSNMFIARGLNFGDAEPDASEDLEMVKMSLDEAVEKVMNGEIVHLISAFLILKAASLKY
jgi:8-oxo-dGTP pyrophosphatase MutT (NUDIX family)